MNKVENRPFAREPRYLVAKLTDAWQALSAEKLAHLKEILAKIEAFRATQGKDELRCVVVEHDWPEYEPIWAAIKARMTGQRSIMPASGIEVTTSLQAPEIGDYWVGQGGLYVGTIAATPHTPARCLIMANRQHVGLPYGPDVDVDGARSRVDGRANTIALLNSGHEHPAAAWASQVTAEGHADFYLPSQAELFTASLNAPHLFEKEGWYRSSTQTSRNGAFVQDFEYGNSDWDDKDIEYRVAAFRAIPLQSLIASTL